MKKWLRRITYLFIILIWLLVMSFPLLAFGISTRGQVTLGSDPHQRIRFFAAEGEDLGGVGVEWTRPFTPNTLSTASTTCTKTNITYFLWEGHSATQNVSFCQCFDPITNAPPPVETAVCN